MLNLIQRSLKPLLILVLVIISVPFIFITTGPVFERNPLSTKLGKIDGHNITAEEFRDAQTSVEALLLLRYGQIPESPQVRQQIQQETWQRLLLLSSAKQSGIKVEDAQVIDFIRNMPALQKDGQYQPERFENLLKYVQQALNISENRFTEIIRDELTVEKMQRLIISPIQVQPSQIADQFNLIYSPATLSTVTLQLKNYLSQVTVTPAEIDSEYKLLIDTNPALRTKERRRVSFIAFPAPAAVKGDAAKDDARRKVSEKALELALALEPEPDAAATAKRPDFVETAKKFNVTVATTGLFAPDETPAPLPPSPNLNRTAFSLSNEHPVSTVVETDTAFYVLKLEEVIPSQPKALAEVKAQIEEAIKTRKAFGLLQQAGTDLAAKLKAEVAKGVPFRTAAAQLKLSVESIPTFVPGDEKLGHDPKLALVRRLAMSLQVGEVSQFIPTATGGMIGSLDSRGTADRKTYGSFETRLQSEMLSQARFAALDEWVRWRSSSSGTTAPAFLSQKAE